MAGPTPVDSDTTTADGTEQSLGGVIAGSKYIIFKIDTRLMQSGDILKVRFYDMVLAAGTLSRFQVETYSGDQTVEPLSPLKESGPFWVDNEMELTMEQTAGTFRDFEWAILTPP
jgi:hypothetical protein